LRPGEYAGHRARRVDRAGRRRRAVADALRARLPDQRRDAARRQRRAPVRHRRSRPRSPQPRALRDSRRHRRQRGRGPARPRTRDGAGPVRTALARGRRRDPADVRRDPRLPDPDLGDRDCGDHQPGAGRDRVRPSRWRTCRSSDGWRAPRSSRSGSATMSPQPRRSGPARSASSCGTSCPTASTR